MLDHAPDFNGGLSKWDVSQVKTMWSMFAYASKFNGDVSDWDVSSATSMICMFFFLNCEDFNGDVGDTGDVSSVTDMSNMFYYASEFNSDVSEWHVSRVTDMTGVFFHCVIVTHSTGRQGLRRRLGRRVRPKLFGTTEPPQDDRAPRVIQFDNDR